MKTITEEKKVAATILDENGFEIYMICDLQKIITGWERDEDDIFTPYEYHFNVRHVYDIVIESGSNLVSIFNVITKNTEMEQSMIETILEDADGIWNTN